MPSLSPPAPPSGYALDQGHPGAVTDPRCPLVLLCPPPPPTPGGYAVIKGIQERLGLPSSQLLPSFASLREYGNTSASTTWYAWGYIESCVGVRKGQVSIGAAAGGCGKSGHGKSQLC